MAELAQAAHLAAAAAEELPLQRCQAALALQLAHMAAVSTVADQRKRAAALVPQDLF